jgi:S-methylmethionine-dependent homocysteine/selenocysteine methylase
MRGDVLITDGGLETTLVFHEGIELPEFAAFPLLDRPDGGCCGTDARDVAAIVSAWRGEPVAAG